MKYMTLLELVVGEYVYQTGEVWLLLYVDHIVLVGLKD